MKTLDLLQKVEGAKVRGAWNNGVKVYAVDEKKKMIELFELLD